MNEVEATRTPRGKTHLQAAEGPSFTMNPSRPTAGVRHTPLVTINIALRGLMEFGIVLALGIWGYHAGTSVATRFLLAIGVPVAGFGFWGAVDFHQAGRLAEPIRLLQELAISMLAGIALVAVGRPIGGLALVVLSGIHHILVYALGQRLITDRTR